MHTPSFLLLTTHLLTLLRPTTSAPQSQAWKQFCALIPQNPAAAEIPAQYLAIPGCEGSTPTGAASGSAATVANTPVQQVHNAPAVKAGAKSGVTGNIPIVDQNDGSENTQNTSTTVTSGNTGGTENTGSTENTTVTGTGASGTNTGTGHNEGAGSGEVNVASSSTSSIGAVATGGSSSSGPGSSGASSSTNSSSSSSSATVSGGLTYKASITRYGKGPPGVGLGTDGNCQIDQGACGNLTQNGATAAASQFWYFNLNGQVGIPDHPGPTCGTCWKVSGSTDGTGNPVSTTSIVVIITNECAGSVANQPDSTNLCRMTSFTDSNQLGGNVDVDLCMDSGATQTFWNSDSPSSWGTAVGSVTQVDCSEWCGTYLDGRKSGPAGCNPGTPIID